MELSKIKPIKIYNNNEMAFNSLLKQITNSKFDGFIKIKTRRTDEGYILFRDGKGIAASYSQYLKNFILDKEFFKDDAILKIEHETGNRSYIMEIFELNHSQINYAIKFNEKYVLEIDYTSYNYLNYKNSNADRFHEKTKKIKTDDGHLKEINIEETNDFDYIADVLDDKNEDLLENKEEFIESINLSEEKIESVEHIEKENEFLYENKTTLDDKTISNKNLGDITIIHGNKEEIITNKNYTEDEDLYLEAIDLSGENNNPESFEENDEHIYDTKDDEMFKQSKTGHHNVKKLIKDIKKAQKEKTPEPDKNLTLKTSNHTKRSINELKYLLKSLSDEEIEMIEMNIMKIIAKSLLTIPKIKHKEVNISIDRNNGLKGKVDITAEYTDKGFLKWITGTSKTNSDYLKNMIFETTQLEIKKTFGNFQEVLDYFDISIKMI